MTVDLVLLLILLFFGAFGARSGAIRQVAHWIGLACGYGAAFFGAPRLTPSASVWLRLTPIATRVALSACLFFIVYPLVSVLLEWLWDRFVGSGRHSLSDRWGGCALGLGKGAIVLFIVGSTLFYFEQPLTAKFGPLPDEFKDSRAVDFIRRHNLFETASTPELSKLETFLRAAKDPQAAQALVKRPDVQALLNDPDLKTLLQDASIAGALETGNVAALRDDPRIAAFLSDQRHLDQLSAMLGQPKSAPPIPDPAQPSAPLPAPAP